MCRRSGGDSDESIRWAERALRGATDRTQKHAALRQLEVLGAEPDRYLDHVRALAKEPSDADIVTIGMWLRRSGAADDAESGKRLVREAATRRVAGAYQALLGQMSPEEVLAVLEEEGFSDPAWDRVSLIGAPLEDGADPGRIARLVPLAIAGKPDSAVPPVPISMLTRIADDVGSYLGADSVAREVADWATDGSAELRFLAGTIYGDAGRAADALSALGSVFGGGDELRDLAGKLANSELITEAEWISARDLLMAPAARTYTQTVIRERAIEILVGGV